MGVAQGRALILGQLRLAPKATARLPRGLAQRLSARYAAGGGGGQPAARRLYEALQRGSDPMLALVAGAKLVEMSGEAQDAVSGQHGAQQLLAAMASTEVYLAHAIAVLAVLRFGTGSHVQQATAHLRTQALDPSLNERLDDALQTRRCTGA